MELRLHEWTCSDYCNLVEYLRSEADTKHRDFHSSLVPDAEKEEILGIRMPKLREIGKEISKGNVRSYLSVATSKLYEERMLKGIVIGLVQTHDFYEFLELFDKFTEEVDNWAICDCFCTGLKQVKKYKKEFFQYINKYIHSENVWKIRIALVLMLDYYLEEEYIDEVLRRCDGIKSDFYYVSMAQAWLVATAVAKCRDQAMAYLHNNKLNDVTHNKAIQKCIESRRIDEDTKIYLRTIKRKTV